MIAPGPRSRAPSLAICGATSSFDAPRVMVSVFPSMKTLSLLAMLRDASCAWAIAKLETLDARAIAVAASADLHLDAVIQSSCKVPCTLLFRPCSTLIKRTREIRSTAVAYDLYAGSCARNRRRVLL